MRSTNQIVIAVQECQPCTEEELRLCVYALHFMLYQAKKAADDMAEAVEAGKPTAKMRAAFWKRDAEIRFKSNKLPVDEYLGPRNTPGTKEHDDGLRMSKAIFKKATGMDL